MRWCEVSTGETFEALSTPVGRYEWTPLLTTIPIWFEITSLVVLSAIILGDLVLAYRRPHIPSARECAAWVGLYVLLALVFAGLLFWVADIELAGQFVAGWLTEYSLSVDNLFVFLIIMNQFKVPKQFQQEVLMVGILIALVLRAIFIIIGAQLIENFSWVFYIFGAFLLYTAFQQAFTGFEDEERTEGRIIKFFRKRFAISDTFNGGKLRIKIDGRRMFTPVLIVIVALGATDLVFALDSIPAIFGITQNPFLVFAANVFALMGLRQLYFLLGDLIEKLVYLKYGIAFILGFIGVKLVLHAMHGNELPFLNGGQPIQWAPEISTWISLAVIVGAMSIATVASLFRLKRDRQGKLRQS